MDHATTDVIAIHKPDILVSGQKQALELIVSGVPLAQVLEVLVKIVERQSDGDAIASILLVDETGTKLRHGAAPSLPDSYNAAIDGLAIAPHIGTCCDAAARCKTVITPDIAADAGWISFRQLPLGLGLRAAWSMPIQNSTGKVLGTFGTYFRTCRSPKPEEQRVVELLCRTAAVAIEHVRTTEALKQREQYLRAIIEATPECIKVVAPDGALLDMNPAGIKMIEAEELSAVQGHSVYKLIAPEYLEQFQAFHKQVCEGNRGTFEFEIVGLQGTRRTMEASAVPLKRPDGSCAQLALTRDITSRKQMENELRDRAEQLVLADRRKDEFLAMLAHELRNPLGPIRNAAHLLKHLLPEDKKVGEVRQIIERQATHMSRLVDDLLDVSRLACGKILLRREIFDLSDLTRSLVRDYRAQFEQKDIHFSASTPDGPIRTNGDKTRIAQAIGNLLHNAQKFTRPGGHTSVSITQDDSFAILAVTDDGIGMDQAIQGHLFEPFSQADRSLDRSTGGLGLGLSLVRGIIELHGGSVKGMSDGPGKGACFEIRLPLISCDKETFTIEDTSGGRDSLNILLIEDNLDALETLNLMLTFSGHHVQTAVDGKTALELLKTFNAQVIICDIGLPEMNGYDVARIVRQDSRFDRTQMIALTGYGQEEDVTRALRAGFDKHLTKPFDPEALERLIAKNQKRR